MEFHKDPYLDHYYLNLRPLSLLISKFPQSKFNIFADDIIIYQTLPLKTMTTHLSLIELIIYAPGYSIIIFTTKYRQDITD